MTASLLLHHTQLLRNASRVLELGAGRGITSLALAVALRGEADNQKQFLITDGEELSLNNIDLRMGADEKCRRHA